MKRESIRTHEPQSSWIDLTVRLIISALLVAAAIYFIAANVRTARAESPQSNAVLHAVQSGDSLHTLAVQYGTTVDEIVAANGLVYPYDLAVGQPLLIPAAPAPVSAREALERFYGWYLAEDAAGQHPLLSGLYAASPYLTTELKQNVEQALFDSQGQGPDPLVCGVDARGPLMVDTSSQASTSDTRAVLHATIGGRSLRADLTNDSGAWQINAIICSAD